MKRFWCHEGKRELNKMTLLNTLRTPSADDVQFQLTAKTVRNIKPMFDAAFDNKKPLRLIFEPHEKVTFSKASTPNALGGHIQLVVTGYASDLRTGEEFDYNPNLINSCHSNYIMIYLDWGAVPKKFKKILEDGDDDIREIKPKSNA